jgi:cellulose synthase/poly-beta-1,6-N-acetylglucosamine synthase-like glycosyltransferase
MNASVNVPVIVFWACALLVSYTYILYPAILLLAYALAQARSDLAYLAGGRRDRRTQTPASASLPGISFIVPARNEEKCLEAKLRNIEELDYPAEKMEVVMVSDGSTDRTAEILQSVNDPRFRILLLERREGKANALNRGVALASREILVFSDAATIFAPSSVQKMVRHFTDPRVGAVCGALQFRNAGESAATEGVYWKYESMMRLMEARLGATLNASGAIYAVRADCFTPLPPSTILDDLMIPMNVRKHGRAILYDPEAVAMESAPETVSGEFARRVRIATGSFRALPELLRNPPRGFTLLAFLSHKLLRWVLPFVLIALALSNLLLLHLPFYRFVCVAQAAFYCCGLAGMVLRERLLRIRFALLPYFLLAMNFAFLVGFFKSLTDRKEAVWAQTS